MYATLLWLYEYDMHAVVVASELSATVRCLSAIGTRMRMPQKQHAYHIHVCIYILRTDLHIHIWFACRFCGSCMHMLFLCNTLTATHRNTLTATYCNTLQHTATHLPFLWLWGGYCRQDRLNYTSLLQNKVSFIGLFCKRDL